MITEFNSIPAGSIFIPGNVPSSKNSKQWTGSKLIWSKPAREYRERTKWIWATEANAFIKKTAGVERPLVVGFFFVRDSARKFDFMNPSQTISDLMVSYGWIPDDNICEILPVPIKIGGEYYRIDKQNPGVYIIPL